MATKVMRWAARLAGCGCLFLGACTLGPDYVRPDTSAQLPGAFDLPAGWKVAEPRDDDLMEEWWRCFGDAELNRLMAGSLEQNQDLAAAFYRVEQARAISRTARGAWFPSFRFEPSADRTKRSGTISNTAANLTGITTTNLSLPLVLDYEIDFWGKLRRAIEAAEAETLASEAAYRQVALTLQGELATQHFSLRALDAEIGIFEEAVELRRKSLDLNEQRFRAGDTDEVDVSRAETELAGTEAELLGLRKSRAEIENAIAVLAGVPSSGFRVAPDPLTGEPPAIPATVPSELLERRPDVAEAERVMAAENARIGIAKAAFFPSVRLSGDVGLASGSTSRLFDLASRTWGVGPEISVPVFEGGRNRAEFKRSEERYDEVVARYRQTVLEAVREVDDALAGLDWLAKQSEAQERTAGAARRTVELSERRYEAGLVAYFEVVDAQRTLLGAEQLAVRLRVARHLATVGLIKALGGGF